MKSMYLTFEDADFKKLQKARKKSDANSWEAFVLELLDKRGIKGELVKRLDGEI